MVFGTLESRTATELTNGPFFVYSQLCTEPYGEPFNRSAEKPGQIEPDYGQIKSTSTQPAKPNHTILIQQKPNHTNQIRPNLSSNN